jgi:hypothetical protein
MVGSRLQHCRMGRAPAKPANAGTRWRAQPILQAAHSSMSRASLKSATHDGTHRPRTEMASGTRKKCYPFGRRTGRINRIRECRDLLSAGSPVRVGTVFHSLAPQGRGWERGLRCFRIAPPEPPHHSFSPTVLGNVIPGDGSSFPEVDKALNSLALMWMEDDGRSRRNPRDATYPDLR